MPLTRDQIVDQIPVDQTTRANQALKNYLLEMLKGINQHRQVIEHAKHRAQQDKVLNDYKKAVGYHEVYRKLVKAQHEEEEAKSDLIKMGLSESGTLLELKDRNRYGERGYWIVPPGGGIHDYIRVTKEEADKLIKTHELIRAVESEMNVFSNFDRLTTRMMMATTVGECMAIVNAVADQDVFKIDQKGLMLEDKKKEKNK